MPRKRAESEKPVAGYFRVSKARDEMSAPDIYRGQIEDYCRYKQLKLGKLYSDIDFSGRRGSKPRPGLAELIEERSRYSAVVIPKLSRLGRSMKDLANLFDIFDSDGIGLVFLDVDVDTRTATGRLVRNIMASLAEWESDLISDRWRDTITYLKKQGRVTGSNPPLGYDYDPELKTLVVNPAESETVREIYERYVDGEPINTMIARFNLERRMTKKPGAKWYYATISTILENPQYAGLIRMDDDLLPANWQPIIERSLWETVQERRRKSKQEYGPSKVRTRGQDHLVSGFLVCGECGAKMHRRARGKVAASYSCPNTIGAAQLRGIPKCNGIAITEPQAKMILVNAFFDYFEKPLRRHAAKKQRTIKSQPKRSLEERLDLIDKQRQKAVVLALDATSPSLEKVYTQQVEALTEEYERVQRESSEARAVSLVDERLSDELEALRKLDLRAAWNAATLAERREMLGVVIDFACPVGPKRSRFDKTLDIHWRPGVV
ncbi:MAG TPA: recombinase family protein [Actinomycetota bacterium]|nr:recombinase family protein [Actinomycetota bacterium]